MLIPLSKQAPIGLESGNCTGLGMKFDSTVCSKYKFNLVDCLIDTEYIINSSYLNLCTEVENLKRFFQNGFSISMDDKCISKKLDFAYELISTVSNSFYVWFPK